MYICSKHPLTYTSTYFLLLIQCFSPSKNGRKKMIEITFLIFLCTFINLYFIYIFGNKYFSSFTKRVKNWSTLTWYIRVLIVPGLLSNRGVTWLIEMSHTGNRSWRKSIKRILNFSVMFILEKKILAYRNWLFRWTFLI